MANNLLNYSDYDFDKLVEQLVQRLQQDSEAWKDTYRSATGQMLIELFSYVGNMVLYYIERRAEESYLDTAQHRSSVINIGRLLNYLPARKTSSSGILKFSIPTPILKTIYIPKWTECQTAGNIKFVTSEDVVILAGGTTVNANAVQGIKVEIEQTPSGAPNQEYKIDDLFIENTNLFIYVDGELWTHVSTFLQSQADSKQYRLRAEMTGTVTVIFGDGIRGKIPGVAQLLLIQYVKSDGINGNVYLTNGITALNSVVYDEDEAEVTNVVVTNEDTFLGGADEESTEELKYEIPRVFSTGDRAVTKDDYIALLENYAGVANANVWGEAEETPPNYNMFNRVKLVLLLQNWSLPNQAFKDAVETYICGKSQLTVKHEFVDAEIILLIPVLDVKAMVGNALSTVSDDIDTALEAQFTLGTTAKLGVSKRLSDMMYSVDDVTGVSYHYMTLEIRHVLVTPFDSSFTWGTLLYATPVLPGSVKVYDGVTLIAIDDGVGGFLVQASGYTVSGVINYVTGYIGLNISPMPAGVVVRYQQNSNGDVVVRGGQIAKLYDVDIVAIGYAN